MGVMTDRADIDAAVSGQTVCTIFATAAKKWGDLPALRWKRDGEWKSLDWKGYRAEVAAVTMALKGLGFGPGQFGLIMARNVPEHVIADLGIVHAGGTAISVYNTLAPEQIEYVANHSEASVAVVEDEAFLAKFLQIRSSTPNLRHLILIRGNAPQGVLSWGELVADGRAALERDPASFEDSARAVGPEDTVSLIYTSGTGLPKASCTRTTTSSGRSNPRGVSSSFTTRHCSAICRWPTWLSASRRSGAASTTATRSTCALIQLSCCLTC